MAARPRDENYSILHLRSKKILKKNYVLQHFLDTSSQFLQAASLVLVKSGFANAVACVPGAW